MDFDAQLAASYVGKYILIGLTYTDHLGNEIRHSQLHGVVESASLEGIKIDLRGYHAGTTWNMPPILDSIWPADSGVYKTYLVSFLKPLHKGDFNQILCSTQKPLVVKVLT
jgi:hypothetical protein